MLVDEAYCCLVSFQRFYHGFKLKGSVELSSTLRLTPSSCLPNKDEEGVTVLEENEEENEEEEEEDPRKVVLYHLSAITSHFGTMEAVRKFPMISY